MSKRKRRLQMQRRKKSRVSNSDTLVKRYISGINREARIPVDCTNDEFEAWTFQAWVNGRDIPIDELCILFNRDRATIRRWQQMKPPPMDETLTPSD